MQTFKDRKDANLKDKRKDLKDGKDMLKSIKGRRKLEIKNRFYVFHKSLAHRTAQR